MQLFSDFPSNIITIISSSVYSQFFVIHVTELLQTIFGISLINVDNEFERGSNIRNGCLSLYSPVGFYSYIVGGKMCL